MKMIKKAKKGFTLIELVVVIAVIAILSGVSVVAYVGITNNAKQRACESEASQLRTIILAADIEDEGFTCEGTSKITLSGYESLDKLLEHLADEDSEFADDMSGITGYEITVDQTSKKATYEASNGKTTPFFDQVIIEE